MVGVFKDKSCFCQIFVLGKLCEKFLHEHKLFLAWEGMKSRA